MGFELLRAKVSSLGGMFWNGRETNHSDACGLLQLPSVVVDHILDFADPAMVRLAPVNLQLRRQQGIAWRKQNIQVVPLGLWDRADGDLIHGATVRMNFSTPHDL